MLILAPNPSQTIKIEASSEAGFSLLEILVVLALMGIMLSVVSVRLVGTAESVYFKKTADDIMANILPLRANAILNDEPRILTLTANSVQRLPLSQRKIARPINLPEGWRVEGDDIFISKTGVCFGGDITLSDNTGRRASYKFVPPACEFSDAAIK